MAKKLDAVSKKLIVCYFSLFPMAASLAVLKLTGLIPLSWVWVIAPIWVPTALAVIATYIIVFVAAGIKIEIKVDYDAKG